jgi:hypothetical protein
MPEIITLLVLGGIIRDMALRRGRSPLLFGLMLFALWFGGELAGAVLGFMLSRAIPNVLLIYILALAGASAGGVIALLIANSLPPVDGVWRDPATFPPRRSRLWGAVAGGVGGGVIGAGIVATMFKGALWEGPLPLPIQAFLVVGFLGALLGLISGVERS